MSEMIKIYCDGGSRGNPGPAASAFVVEKDCIRIDAGSEFLGVSTNNLAEYQSLILSLEWLVENSEMIEDKRVVIYMDSELITKQVNGEYRVRNKRLMEKALKVHQLLTQLGRVEIIHVKREKNKEADRLVNESLDSNT